MIYIATMRPYGREAEERIRRHHKLRSGKGFATVECYANLSESCLGYCDTVLLEDLGNLAANELFRPGVTPDGAYRSICVGLENLEARSGHLLVVTSDIFRDGCSYPVETEAYMRLLGAVNACAAQRYERVVEIVSGTAVWHKGRQT